MITPEEALPQATSDLQRRVINHLSTCPGWSTSDRLMSELFPRPTIGIGRMQYDTTKRQLVSALRRLQHIGFIRYDADTGGWVR